MRIISTRRSELGAEMDELVKLFWGWRRKEESLRVGVEEGGISVSPPAGRAKRALWARQKFRRKALIGLLPQSLLFVYNRRI